MEEKSRCSWCVQWNDDKFSCVQERIVHFYGGFLTATDIFCTNRNKRWILVNGCRFRDRHWLLFRFPKCSAKGLPFHFHERSLKRLLFHFPKCFAFLIPLPLSPSNVAKFYSHFISECNHQCRKSNKIESNVEVTKH